MKTTTKTSALNALLNITDVNAVLRAMWNTPGLAGDDGEARMGLNVLFEAPPGVGKSTRIRAASRRSGLHCETVIASLREPADFLGLGVPQANGELRYMPPTWALRAAKHEHAVVFLDELNAAPQAVQMALLRVVLEGVVGDLRLPNSVRFVAAQNGVDSCPGRFGLDSAMVNRFIILPWPDVDPRGWASWLLNPAGANDAADIDDPGDVAAQVAADWPSAWAKAAGIVSAFITRRSDLLTTAPSDDGKPFATPRSWETATRALGGALLHGLNPSDTDAVIAGAVGAGAAREFSTFRSNLDLPDPAAVLDGAGFTHDPARLDRTMAVLSSCASLVVARTCDNRDKRVNALLGLLLKVTQGGAADAAVLSSQVLLGPDNAFRTSVLRAPNFKAAFSALEPFTAAAGMRVK